MKFLEVFVNGSKKSKEASPMILEHVQLSNVHVCAGLEIHF